MATPFRIVSGGQTGVDRAALDAALRVGIACGGWCPRGRRAEDGQIALRYPLSETPDSAYRQRTEWNVRDSQATLIVSPSPRLEGGTDLTWRLGLWLGRPMLVIHDCDEGSGRRVLDWIRENEVEVLNVAGPRESECPGIYRRVLEFLNPLFLILREMGSS